MPSESDERLIEPMDLADWQGGVSSADQERALQAVEGGKVLFFPQLAFALSAEELRLLDPSSSDGKAKNVSFDPRNGAVRGTSVEGDDRLVLAQLLRRFGTRSLGIVSALFPRYADHLEMARASLRPSAIGERGLSFRKDDRLLHVDAFPSQPMQGRRILRVFSNVDPAGSERVWRIGPAFEDCAIRAKRHLRQPLPGSSQILAWAGVTKGRRAIYDWLMLALHDGLKADQDFQRNEWRLRMGFPAGSTWIVFSDAVVHSAIAGQHALEQTFYLPVAAMENPALSPLRILERLTGRSLA